MPRHGEEDVQVRADGLRNMHMRVADGVCNDGIRLQHQEPSQHHLKAGALRVMLKELQAASCPALARRSLKHRTIDNADQPQG